MAQLASTKVEIIVGVAGEHEGTIGMTLALSDGSTVEYTIARKMARRLSADLDRAIADNVARDFRCATG
jgi:CheY-specific phosphatase CheX